MTQTLRKSTTKNLRVPDGQGGMTKMEFKIYYPAADDEQFMQCLSHMVLSTREDGEFNSEYELPMMQEAMRREDAKIIEVYNAFWKAYQDPYLPSAGMEWRHIWKHIQEIRDYSYSPRGQRFDPQDLERKQQQYGEEEAQIRTKNGGTNE